MILSRAQIGKVVELIGKEIPLIRGIYLFGSGTSDSFTDTSDVDLAIISDTAINNRLVWDLKYKLSEILHREVDLIDLQPADTVLQMQVVTNGVRLFTSDEKESDWFESKVWWNYFTLNEDRAVILEEIAKTKTIYR
ncbi:MAG: nucleotidyltransferase domain-containing protein [Marinoscillum sp.]